jgi:hypothetical protein
VPDDAKPVPAAVSAVLEDADVIEVGGLEENAGPRRIGGGGAFCKALDCSMGKR